MTSRTVYRELATAGLLLASYPIDLITRQSERYLPRLGLVRDPVILAHGLGGSRANFLAFAAYIRLTGFSNISFFEYARWQSIAESAEQLDEMVKEVAPTGGVHLIGHSLGEPSRNGFQRDRALADHDRFAVLILANQSA